MSPGIESLAAYDQADNLGKLMGERCPSYLIGGPRMVSKVQVRRRFVVWGVFRGDDYLTAFGRWAHGRRLLPWYSHSVEWAEEVAREWSRACVRLLIVEDGNWRFWAGEELTPEML